MTKRAGALCIRDKKLLLLCEHGKDYYWTPGGKLEPGEKYKEALKRELDEELNATLLSAKGYFGATDTVTGEVIEYFLVELEIPDKLPDPRTKIIWYGRAEFEANDPPVSKRVSEVIVPELIELGLL